MELVEQVLASNGHRRPSSDRGRGWMFLTSLLFWATAIGLAVSAAIRNPGTEPAKAHPRSIPPDLGPETNLVKLFAFGRISASEFTEQCAAGRGAEKLIPGSRVT